MLLKYYLLVFTVYILILIDICNGQFFEIDNGERFGYRARFARILRIRGRQRDRRKTLRKALGYRNYVKLYGKHLGVFPGAFGLLRSGSGALGLKNLGAGGLNDAMDHKGLGGAKVFLDTAGKRIGVADKLGTDLLGRYGILSPAGVDDIFNGVIGDTLFNPGAILELDKDGKRFAAIFGVASGPAIAAAKAAKAMGVAPVHRLSMMASASLAGLGALGLPGIGLGATAGGLSAATSGFGFLGTGLGTGIGAGLAAGGSRIPVIGTNILASLG